MNTITNSANELDKGAAKSKHIRIKSGYLTAAEKEEFLRSNMRLLFSVVEKHKRSGIEYQELVSAVNLGATKAFNSFDQSKGAKLSTYVFQCANNEVCSLIRQLSGRKNIKVVRSNNEKELLPVSLLSLNCSGSESGTDDGSYFLESIQDDINIEEEVIEKERDREFKGVVKKLVSHLDSREREILSRRFGLFGHLPETQLQIAESLGTTQARIHNMETQAIEKLKLIARYTDTRIEFS